jgi:cytochrome c-type biogenesis protein CcmH/NrfG
MNNNIRRLLAQAYLEQADIRDTTKIAEQFAQMIIEEATDIVYDMLDKDTGSEVVVAVKEHFGVL